MVAATLQASLSRQPRQLISQLVIENIHTTIIACHPEHPEVIFGFLMFSRSRKCIHFVFVKPAFRGFGIAAMMLAEAFKTDVPKYYTLISQDKPTELIKRHKLVYAPIAMMTRSIGE